MTRKTIKLIAPDKNGILDYQGDCKLTIDARFSKALIVEPKNKDFLDICAFFRWKFIQRKNLLFVFAELKIQDFVLIFANEEICQKVRNIIYRYKEDKKDYLQEEELRQRLLIPIFQKLPQNYSTRFKRVIIDWIEKHEENEKMELIKLYKKRNIQMMDVKNVKEEPNSQNPRKRRFSEMENNDGIEDDSTTLNAVRNNDDVVNVKSKRKKAGLSCIKIINESCFKIVNVKRGNGFHRKLLICASPEKSKCYEYKFHPTMDFFYHRCQTSLNEFKAVLQFDENGNECVKFENKPHVCSPIEYDPKKYVEMKIVKKPNYEILENCATKSKKTLFIFDSKDKNQCYEYYWSSCYKKFQCCGCSSKKKQMLAEIVHENSENEYIRLLHDEHVCEIRKFEPKKYPESYNFILPPNFEIQTKIRDGIEKETLTVFNGNDRKLCYTYFFATRDKVFCCKGCIQKQKQVSARIIKNNDDDYVILSNAKHVCAPKEYISQSKVLIFRPPKIKFIESNEKFKPKIIIFASNDNQLCYIFTQSKNTKKFYCLGCNKLTKPKKEFCFIYLCKENENLNDGGSNAGDKYFVKMADDQKHICKPQKYEPQKYYPEEYQRKLLKPSADYVLYQRNVINNGYPGLVIYDSNDKNLCYNFYYYKTKNCFRCIACHGKGGFVTAKIQQDSDGNEYIIMNQKKHVCKPIKVSSIIKPNTVILEKSGLSVEPKKKKEIDENRIVYLPNFELQKNRYGASERKLIVFYGNDNSLCYEYRYKDDVFICKKCKSRAKLSDVPEKNNEKYIILSENEHTCVPVKYVAEKKIIRDKKNIVKSSNFMIFKRDDKSKPTKLVIFTSSSKEFCYEYSFLQCEKIFRCSSCFSLKKYVCAKLLNNSEGEECVQLLKNGHICTPKKFILEEFQPKIIPEN